MTATVYPNGIVSFEIEPDPQAAAKLKDFMAQFSANAATAPSNGGLLLATVNNTLPPIDMDDVVIGRFRNFVAFTPLGEDDLKKIFHKTTGKLLDEKGLTPRQRGAAEKFIATSGQAYDPDLGARGVVKQAAKLLGGSDFAELMNDHSPGGTQRSFENAIRTGAKTAGAAPATARFKPRRKP